MCSCLLSKLSNIYHGKYDNMVIEQHYHCPENSPNKLSSYLICNWNKVQTFCLLTSCLSLSLLAWNHLFQSLTLFQKSSCLLWKCTFWIYLKFHCEHLVDVANFVIQFLKENMYLLRNSILNSIDWVFSFLKYYFTNYEQLQLISSI